VGELDRFQRCQEHLALWLRSSLTGCHFATSFSSTKPLKIDYYTPISEAIDLAAIAGFIDGTATNEVVAVVLFPSVRTPADLARTLVTLCGDPRWQVGEESWPKGRERPDSVALSLIRKTASGDISDAMGVAPLGTMPVTRRAPYVAIVVWGGSHLNPHIRRTDHVGVASAPTGLDKAEHGRLMKITDQRVRELLREPAEDPEWLRHVGFILPSEACGPLRALLKPEMCQG
jgi:hypothetical protein